MLDEANLCADLVLLTCVRSHPIYEKYRDQNILASAGKHFLSTSFD